MDLEPPVLKQPKLLPKLDICLLDKFANLNDLSTSCPTPQPNLRGMILISYRDDFCKD